MVQQNYEEETTNSKKPTLRRESTIKKENLNGESHGDREEFQPEENKRWRRNQQGFLCSRRSPERISFVVIMQNREVQLTCREKNHFLFTRFILLNETHPKRKYTMRSGNWRSQNIWGNNKLNCFWSCRERTEFCTLLQLCARIRSYEKISRKLFTWLSSKVKASTCCLVSRHSVSVTQNSSSKPQNPGSTKYSQVRTWEERSMNSKCCSDRRTSGIDSYVWFGRLRRSVSQRRRPRETEKYE